MVSLPAVCPACHVAIAPRAKSRHLRCGNCNTRLSYSLSGLEFVSQPIYIGPLPEPPKIGRKLDGKTLKLTALYAVMATVVVLAFLPRGPHLVKPTAAAPVTRAIAPLQALATVQFASNSRDVPVGEALFHRVWEVGQPLISTGDGLGPAFNGRSCFECHSLGGSGGAGALEHNVDLVSARTTSSKSLTEIHNGFRTANSVVIHRFGTAPNYAKWRTELLGEPRTPLAAEDNPFIRDLRRDERAELRDFMEMEAHFASLPAERFRMRVVRSQRNPTALFGSGLIDAIPDSAIESLANRKHAGFPWVRGRVHRLKDGSVGRFGWKAQVATLEDFVLKACSVELGLEVPGHHQADLPGGDSKVTGLDLSADQTSALTQYVRVLPRPAVSQSASDEMRLEIERGEEILEKIGCATCHPPSIGGVDGIYSDLLLHDMGQDLADAGLYYDTLISPPKDSVPNPAGTKTAKKTPKGLPPSPSEWRTPPLWGYRDSGPYLHDGRAKTLAQVVALHGGEADQPAQNFFKLSVEDRLKLQRFLESLVAPSQP